MDKIDISELKTTPSVVIAHAKKVAEWALLLVIGFLPVFFVPVEWVLPAQAKLLLIIAGSAVALGALVIAALYERVIHIPRSGLLVAGLLLPMTYGISALISHAPGTSWVSPDASLDTVVRIALLYILMLISSLVVAATSVSSQRLIKAFGLGSAVFFLFTFARFVAPSLLSFGGLFSNAAATPMGLPHDVGILAGLFVVAAGAWMYSRIGGKELSEWVIAGLGLISFILLFAVNVADVWFAVSAVSLLCAGLTLWSDVHNEKRSISLAALGMSTWVVIAVIALVMGFYGGAITSRLPANMQMSSIEVRPSWQGTVAVGEQVFAKDQRTLLFGSGPNTFARAWVYHKPEGINLTNFWGVSFTSGVGLIPTSIVTVGILGALAWILLLGIVLGHAVNLFILRRTSIRDQSSALFLAIVLFLLFFHVVYVPNIALSALMFIMLGIFISLEARRRGTHPLEWHIGFESQRQVLTFVATGAFVCVVAVAGVVATRATLSGVLVQRAVAMYRTTGDLVRPRALVQLALKIHPENTFAQRAAVELGTLELARLASITDAQSEAGKAQLQTLLSQTIQYGLAAVSIDGTDYQNWLALADMYQKLAGSGVNGSYEYAKQAYEKAIEANPNDPSLYVRLAQLEEAKQDQSSALRYINRAIELKKNYPMSYFLRSRIYAEAGDLKAAQQDALIVTQMIPQDPLGWFNLGTILYLSGMHQDAVVAFKQAITLRNDYADAYYGLSLAYERLNNHEDAVSALKRVAQLNPDNKEVQEAIRRIQAGPATSATSTNATSSVKNKAKR